MNGFAVRGVESEAVPGRIVAQTNRVIGDRHVDAAGEDPTALSGLGTDEGPVVLCGWGCVGFGLRRLGGRRTRGRRQFDLS